MFAVYGVSGRLYSATPEQLLAHTASVRRLARDLVGDASAADDVVQDWAELFTDPAALSAGLGGAAHGLMALPLSRLDALAREGAGLSE